MPDSISDLDPPSKTISLKLPSTLEARLATTAYRRGVSKSSLVREAVTRYLVHGLASEENTFKAQAGRLVGSVEGPEDLSTNPEYLEDFGR